MNKINTINFFLLPLSSHKSKISWYKFFKICCFMVIVCIFSSLSSCSIEKRLYSSGYHIEFYGKTNKPIANNVHNETNKNAQNPKTQPDFSIQNKTEEDNHPIGGSEFQKQQLIFAENTEKGIEVSDLSIHAQNTPSNIYEDQKYQEFNYAIPKVPIAKEYEEDSRVNGLALAGFVCSLVGFLFFLIFGFPYFLALIGTVLSSIGLYQSVKKSANFGGKGFAITGLVVGIVAMLLTWIGLLLLGSLVFALL